STQLEGKIINENRRRGSKAVRWERHARGHLIVVCRTLKVIASLLYHSSRLKLFWLFSVFLSATLTLSLVPYGGVCVEASLLSNARRMRTRIRMKAQTSASFHPVEIPCPIRTRRQSRKTISTMS